MRSNLSQIISSNSDPRHLRDELLPEIFVTSAERDPTRLAAHFRGLSLTYGELHIRSNQLAKGLQAQGVGRGDFVGLWMERSLDLHVALLGILKAGAAYLPFDVDAPIERIASCLNDCQAKAIILDQDTGAKAGPLAVACLQFATLTDGVLVADAPNLRDIGVGPEDPAYVIYTSGSTGTPKGVVISHRNICHYLRAANSIYDVQSSDIVFQGASVAFDLSLEEIFLPYLVGARMWIAGRRTLQESDRLAETLRGAGVTVMSAVPTLLAMISSDIPTLRLIILGGEAFPPGLAERWCRAGRRVLNSYGPTEATVVATIAEVFADQPITLGQPIPNYSCYIVDEALQLVSPGAAGELLIGGPGVASGYLNRPQLTAEKFINNPFNEGGADPLLYRSGDEVSLDDQGRLLFHGRIDDQVKIRGFRIELGEIEARLSKWPGVSQASVVVRQDGGSDYLVAFLVVDDQGLADQSALRQSLRQQLPCYMVPAHFEVIEELPRLISGKVDRKRLQQVALSTILTEAQEEPETPTEAVLLDAAKRVFPNQAIPFDADIFVDLGGHSLIAARFVSAVRETKALAGLTLQDVYAARTLRAISSRLDSRIAEQPASQAESRSLAFTPPGLSRRLLCGLAQAAALPVILSLTTAPWLGVFVAYQCFSGDDHNFLQEVSALLGTYAVINIATMLIAIAAKWLVLGRTKPGRYPLWGVYFFRWWLAQRFVGVIHLKWFQATPIMRLALRALGAKIGAETIISDLYCGAIDLLSIGAGTSIGGKAQFANAAVVGAELVIGRIFIGDDASIGTSCVIGPDVIIGEGAQIGDLTSLQGGVEVGPWEVWDGSPGRLVGPVDRDALPAAATAPAWRKAVLAGLYGLMLVLLPPITLIPIIPAFYLFDSLNEVLTGVFPVSELFFLPILAWPTAMLLILVTILLIAGVRWTVLPRVNPGTYSIYSWFYLRKWIVALATELTLETLSSLFATVYMRNWYRLMGAKIGHDAEISTNLSGRYDLTEIGEKCFIADEVEFGDEDIRRGWMILKPVKTEARVFVGNDAVVAPGTTIPTGTLIGIKSRPPLANDLMAAGDIWFGSPPIRLPVRQRFDDVTANWTYEPTRWRRLGRAVFEAFTVSLPTMLFITLGTVAVDALAPAILERDFVGLVPMFMLTSVLMSCASLLAAVLVKWVTMGTYRPTMRPMWSWWALRTEAVAVMYWGMAGQMLLEQLRGTPMLPWVLRMFGCKFGQGIFMDSTDITEFDCVYVEDFAVINAMSALQTHLYEDRVMKVGEVRVGKGVTVGYGSTVLYDTRIGDYARIGQLTIIMKGEEIPAHSQWHGAPAQEAQEASAPPPTPLENALPGTVAAISP
ncbi:MAG TPA: amino acid adenylation domain-containing protein [Rhodospirillaceae bacterium]|nr:amino acid adenylation domain-containing protein [Rhodospirillaceae bacterium]